jgi:hypothetical protein
MNLTLKLGGAYGLGMAKSQTQKRRDTKMLDTLKVAGALALVIATATATMLGLLWASGIIK